MPQASVVVATYNRLQPLRRLLERFAEQQPREQTFEVIVVDDASAHDPESVVGEFSHVLDLKFVRLERNQGVAVARQKGVELASGRVVIFVDDDMLPVPSFIDSHVRAHDGHATRVAMGPLVPAECIDVMPLFERYHAYQMELAARRYAAEGTFRGHDVYTGNLSMTRDTFWRAGAFDPSFHLEDVELGLRLERLGVSFVFVPEAVTVHGSDHTSLERWLARSVRDGRDWVRLLRKHPDSRAANPWHFFARSNPLSKPFFACSAFAPSAAPPIAQMVVTAAKIANSVRFDRATLAAMTLLYGIEFFSGVALETKSRFAMARDYRAARLAYAKGLEPRAKSLEQDHVAARA